MTTTVKILIEGNKNTIVKVIGEDGKDYLGYPPKIVAPNTFHTVCIHGNQHVDVVETGDFIS